MRKTFIAAAIAALGSVAANAQVIEQPSFGDNWTIGIDGGVVTPMANNPFFGAMRPIIGVHFGKQVTPVLGIGVEGYTDINTSTWRGRQFSHTAFDNSYVGLYGTTDLFNLFGGYKCRVRPFTIETMISAGWGHDYFASRADDRDDYNYFVTRAGLNFNFNVTDNFSIAIRPAVTWDMSSATEHAYNSYNREKATFSITAGVAYRFGQGFKCVRPYNQSEIDALNGQINDLRTMLESATIDNAAMTAQVAALAADLAACENQPKQIVKEIKNEFNSVRFVFFKIGSDKVTADQMPNVEMIADYLKSHPDAKVSIKGYASKDGNYDFNLKLAKNRAESVKNLLINKYKIYPTRITAEGEGIGNMFDEESWNRVSICTIER